MLSVTGTLVLSLNSVISAKFTKLPNSLKFPALRYSQLGFHYTALIGIPSKVQLLFILMYMYCVETVSIIIIQHCFSLWYFHRPSKLDLQRYQNPMYIYLHYQAAAALASTSTIPMKITESTNTQPPNG